MFTGLVEEIGAVRRIERVEQGARLMISADSVLVDSKVGDSIAVSGACLTVASIGSDHFVADCMAETLERTTLGRLVVGREVNLERSLSLGGRVGGHLVLGHVDAVVEVIDLRTRGESREIRFTLPAEVSMFIAEKGSVALDGVSLTVIGTDDSSFVVGLIPHTIGATTLQSIKRGGEVNLEADVVARYVHRSVMSRGSSDEALASGEVGLTMELLNDEGFV